MIELLNPPSYSSSYYQSLQIQRIPNDFIHTVKAVLEGLAISFSTMGGSLFAPSNYSSTELDAQETTEHSANTIVNAENEDLEGLALAMSMTKVILRTEQLSLSGTKYEIEAIDQRTAEIRQSRLETHRQAAAKEKACKRWSIMTKVFSWLTTTTIIVSGIALIATGAGVAAGTMLLVSGLLSLTNHLLEMTGTWNKIAMKLGEDSVKTRSIIMWIQVTITAVSLVLAGAGAIFGGFAAIQDAMSTAGTFFSGVANAGVGTLMISIAILNRDFYRKQAIIKKYEMELEELKHHRKDLLEQIEGHGQNREETLSYLTRVLKMHDQVTRQIIHLIKR